ncbi:hypothetical protein TRIP_B200785 [uncultured Desulfatiglans sp.]|nr:hypothetical protein TRIP_B200785 [uncultured Desulfatiglans sp.]
MFLEWLQPVLPAHERCLAIRYSKGWHEHCRTKSFFTSAIGNRQFFKGNPDYAGNEHPSKKHTGLSGCHLMPSADQESQNLHKDRGIMH